MMLRAAVHSAAPPTPCAPELTASLTQHKCSALMCWMHEYMLPVELGVWYLWWTDPPAFLADLWQGDGDSYPSALG